MLSSIPLSPLFILLLRVPSHFLQVFPFEFTLFLPPYFLKLNLRLLILPIHFFYRPPL